MQRGTLSDERERLQLGSIMSDHLLPAGCRWPAIMKLIVTAVVQKGVCVCVCYMSNVYSFLFCIHARARAPLWASFGDLENDTRMGHCLPQLLFLICIKYVKHHLAYNTHLLIT